MLSFTSESDGSTSHTLLTLRESNLQYSQRRPWRSMSVHQLESSISRRKKLLEILRSPLASIHASKHLHIRHPRGQINQQSYRKIHTRTRGIEANTFSKFLQSSIHCSNWRQHISVPQYHTSVFQRRDQISEDSDTVLVRPVMENETNIEYQPPSAREVRLRSEES